MLMPLCVEYAGRERVVQNQRAATQEPWQQREAQAGERRRRQSREDVRVLPEPRFAQDRQPAREQFGMTARNRDRAGLADVERDGSHMRGGIVLAIEIGRRQRRICFGSKQIVERDHAIGEILSERAQIPDGEHLGGDLHRQSGVVEGADVAAGDQRSRADARERHYRVGAPPQQRQRRRDHAGAPDAEHGQKVLDDIRQLDADDGVGWQTHAAQPARDRGNDAVRLGKGEPARLAVGEARAVRRVDEGERVGMEPGEVTEHVLDGHVARSRRRIAEDHCIARFGSRHHVSGR